SALLGLLGADKSSMSAPSQSGARLCWSDGTTRRRDSSCVFRLSRYLRSTWLCGRRVRLLLDFVSWFSSGTVGCVDDDFSRLVLALEVVEGSLFAGNLRPLGPLDSLSLRFRFGRGLSASDSMVSGICTSCDSNDVATVSGKGRSPKRNGAQAPPQLAGSGG